MIRPTTLTGGLRASSWKACCLVDAATSADEGTVARAWTSVLRAQRPTRWNVLVELREGSRYVWRKLASWVGEKTCCWRVEVDWTRQAGGRQSKLDTVVRCTEPSMNTVTNSSSVPPRGVPLPASVALVRQ